MKTPRLSTYVRIALVVSVAGLTTACVSSPYYHDPDPYYSPRASVYYDYWYYPAIGAYYDPHARTYIYYEHDHWIHARALPPRMRPHLGHYVTVRSPHDRPYEEHHRHRQQYQPERYREREHNHRGDDVWIGAPLGWSPQRDRNDRRVESHDRDRDGNDRRHKTESSAVTFPPHYRYPDDKYPRQVPDKRRDDAPRHREPSADTAPIKWEDSVRQLRDHNKKSREQYSNGDRHNNERRSDTHTRQPGQVRTPDRRVQPPKAPPQAAPVHRQPPTRTAPVKNDDKKHQRDNHKEDAKHRYREGDDRRDKAKNGEDEDAQKRYRRPYDQYEQYR